MGGGRGGSVPVATPDSVRLRLRLSVGGRRTSSRHPPDLAGVRGGFAGGHVGLPVLCLRNYRRRLTIILGSGSC